MKDLVLLAGLITLALGGLNLLAYIENKKK